MYTLLSLLTLSTYLSFKSPATTTSVAQSPPPPATTTPTSTISNSGHPHIRPLSPSLSLHTRTCSLSSLLSLSLSQVHHRIPTDQWWLR
ncbi:hypothetical protein HanLR1_Chr06g0220231 [Helianthus annuus]|nr:hypothetical protein HanHA89_Chr06g0236301 [Helianthus annuus]KAJ0738610.1 hypothetical protein HanLR1_Chr06g0220231 [Helianthus annuus]